MRVKGISMSEFTPEECTRLEGEGGGNMAVNSRYLSLYDPKTCLPAPNPTASGQKVLAFLTKNYTERAWYRDALDEERSSERSRKAAESKEAEAAKSVKAKRNENKFSLAPPTNVKVKTKERKTTSSGDGAEWDAFAGGRGGGASSSPPAPAKSGVGQEGEWEAFGMQQSSFASPPAAAAGGAGDWDAFAVGSYGVGSPPGGSAAGGKGQGGQAPVLDLFDAFGSGGEELIVCALLNSG